MVSNTSEITIVGGGFAGLAAALRLHKAGAKIHLIEKRPFFGGRAYSFKDKATGETLDNGQHLLMGCYHETLKFLRDLGTLDKLHIQDNLTLSFAEDAETFHQLRCPNLPAPLHLALGLLKFKGLKFRDKFKMLGLMKLAKKSKSNGQDLDELSVLELLKVTGQTPDTIRKFWEPLGLGALNESIEFASAQLFTEILRRALLSKKSDSNLALSTVGLSELFATPAQEFFKKHGVPISFQTQVEKIEKSGTGFLLRTNCGTAFQTQLLLLAVPPNALGKILKSSGPSFENLVAGIHRFEGTPIVSINLWFEGFLPQETFVGLIDSPIHWLFNKAKILTDEKVSHLTLVVSGAQDLAQQSKEELIQLALQELQKYYPQIRGRKLRHAQVVKELEATFSGRLGLNRFRPDSASSVPGLYLAGDWTNTGLPGTIESAVMSGHRAAEEILMKKD